jgi:hypothetical protein
VRRFKLGLYTMRRRSGDGFDIRGVIKPPLTPESQPEDLNGLLSYFLRESDSLRQEIPTSNRPLTPVETGPCRVITGQRFVRRSSFFGRFTGLPKPLALRNCLALRG